MHLVRFNFLSLALKYVDPVLLPSKDKKAKPLSYLLACRKVLIFHKRYERALFISNIIIKIRSEPTPDDRICSSILELLVDNKESYSVYDGEKRSIMDISITGALSFIDTKSFTKVGDTQSGTSEEYSKLSLVLKEISSSEFEINQTHYQGLVMASSLVSLLGFEKEDLELIFLRLYRTAILDEAAIKLNSKWSNIRYGNNLIQASAIIPDFQLKIARVGYFLISSY